MGIPIACYRDPCRFNRAPFEFNAALFSSVRICSDFITALLISVGIVVGPIGIPMESMRALLHPMEIPNAFDTDHSSCNRDPHCSNMDPYRIQRDTIGFDRDPQLNSSGPC